MDFSENLKTIRLGRGMTQKSLGQSIGVTPVTIGNWERGARQPSFDTPDPACKYTWHEYRRTSWPTSRHHRICFRYSNQRPVEKIQSAGCTWPQSGRYNMCNGI